MTDLPRPNMLWITTHDISPDLGCYAGICLEPPVEQDLEVGRALALAEQELAGRQAALRAQPGQALELGVVEGRQDRDLAEAVAGHRAPAGSPPR